MKSAAYPGHRENPLELRDPHDLDRATRHVARPSPDQARAGNYRKAHVVVGGLDVTIENPKDSFRRGVDLNGQPWEVRMPCHYGYVKRTLGSDGDHVDVYLGPHSHEAESHPVWVIDQVDADSRAFDEHKCMLGFPHVHLVRDAYTAAFSDGRALDRVGAVTRLTFREFKDWLSSGVTQRPLSYKSALRADALRSYGAVTCCPACADKAGGHTPMTTNATSGNAATEPKALGGLFNIIKSVWGKLTPEEQQTMMADAATAAGTEIGKAADLLQEGDDRTRIGSVEDVWDGAPDDRATVRHTGGPNSKVPSGTIGVGSTQSASGDGAARMERQYSEFAPQGGVQSATERLGREVAGMRGAMKSFLKGFEGFNAQIEMLKGSVAAAPAKADVEAMVAKAVADAVAPLTKSLGEIEKRIVKLAARPAVAKGEKEGEKESTSGHETEEEDEEAEQEESGGGDKIEIINEMEDEAESDEDKDSAKKAASLVAKAQVRAKFASRRAFKARDFVDAGEQVAASRQIALANVNVAKAQAYLEAAKAVAPGLRLEGPIGKSVVAAVAKARKGLGEAQSENQKKWPSTTESSVGKGGAATVPAQGAQADLNKAVEMIGKALEGQGLLTANVQQLMDSIAKGNQSRTDGASGGSANLPPVFALAKAGGDAVAAAEQRLHVLAESNVITADQFDAARDTLTRARMGLPEDTVQAMVARLPKEAQEALALPKAA